jgi:hypothetical protein
MRRQRRKITIYAGHSERRAPYGAMRTAATYPDKLAEPRFSYAEVENSLAAALDIKDAWRTLFRSRVKHFQRLGINGVGVRPGKGSSSSFKYSFEQAARLAIVFLLADVGLAPAMCVQLVNERWGSDLRRRIRQAVEPGTRDGEGPWFLTLRLEAMRGLWAKQPVAEIGAYRVMQRLARSEEEKREEAKAQLPKEQYEAWLADRQEQEPQKPWLHTGLRPDLDPGGRNVCIFSLSYVLHRLKDRLDHNWEASDVAQSRDHADLGAKP